jgi:hypothetical protein
VLGYSSSTFYADEGSFEEPMGRESLQKLWQKYKVDIAIYGHAHNYERTCPIYQVRKKVQLVTLEHVISLCSICINLKVKAFQFISAKPVSNE